MSHSESEHGASPSVWPVTLALGLTLLVFGVVTSIAFTVVGGAVTLVGTIAWLEALRHE